MSRSRKAAVLVGAFALTTGLSVVPAFAEDDDSADSTPAPQEVPAPQPDAASNVGPFGGPSDPDSDGPGSSESRSAGSLGFSADDPSWIAWVSQFDGIDWNDFDWEDFDWDEIEPLPVATIQDDEPIEAADGPEDIPLGSCGWWWILDWPLEGGPDDPLPIDYGAGGKCNFPALGYPSWDMFNQTQLLDVDGEQVDLADPGYNAWDCLGCDGVSGNTVNVDWPGSWEVDAHGAIMLYPGCDPLGCADPNDWWIWLDVPEGCQGYATPVILCDFSTGLLHVGETVCGDSWVGGDAGTDASVDTYCSGSSMVSNGSVTLDSQYEDHCAYIWAWFADGTTDWAGTCEPGATEEFSWTSHGKVVQFAAWTQENAS